MGCCTSAPTAPPPTAAAGLPAIELGAYEPSTPFLLSIPDAIDQYHSTFPPCTLASLQQQRDEYWHTRVEGDQAVWLVLRRVCECEEGDGMRDVMLESSGLQYWSIDKPDGVFTYDVKGVRYDVPFFCLYLPRTLITPQQEAANAASPQPTSASTPTASDLQPSPHYTTQPSPSGTSTTTTTTITVLNSSTSPTTLDNNSPNSSKALKFKIRFSDNSYSDLPLALSPTTPLALLRVLVRERVGLSEERQVYFLHGKRIVDGAVGDIGLEKGMVLQCFVKQIQEPV